MKRFVPVVVLVALALSCSPVETSPKREICGNQLDDDDNGKTDCDDPDCAGQANCPGPTPDGGVNYGTCPKCGQSCSKQSECIDHSWDFDTPLADCVAGRCQSFNQNVQVAFEWDTRSTWNGFMYPLRTTNTRFIKKRALDGGAVTCDSVQAVASGKTEADAAQIEASGLFNFLGYDVSPNSANPGSILRQPFMNVGTGSDFLIWTEFWAGPREATTHLPTGNRFGWGCFEGGAEVGEVKLADNCILGDAGCRTIRVAMPGPQ